MTERGEKIQQAILANVDKHPHDIAQVTANQFGITRQAVNKHLRHLVNEGLLVVRGGVRKRHYEPAVLSQQVFQLDLEGLEEDAVWRSKVAHFLSGLPDNVIDIWHYGFTEMLNNAIDHSQGNMVIIEMTKTAGKTTIAIADDGVGIFKKIQEAMDLEDERHAILELAKGKLTTDPERHTGEGIFFTSRMFDDFNIISGEVHFLHHHEFVEDWIVEKNKSNPGTLVIMELNNYTKRTTKEVFEQFAPEEGDYGFTKTVVPVRLARYGTEKLVSRSQAKRLLARVDRFRTVILDFSGIDFIGRAFADEIFRIFRKNHPEVEIAAVNTNETIDRIISHALESVAGEKGGRS